VNNAGCGILEIKSKYSFSKHVIFSLLKGRTIIIHAQPSNEGYFEKNCRVHKQRAVRKMILALSLFVPGHWRKHPAVISWQTRTPRMTDLSHSKLIGLSKQITIPAAIEVT
jgi:hypothetical protein